MGAKVVKFPRRPSAHSSPYAALLGTARAPESASRALLTEMLTTIERMVADKRGQPVVTGIKRRWPWDDEASLRSRHDALLAAYVPQRRGRRPKPKATPKIVRRAAWATPAVRDGLIAEYERGVALLREQGCRRISKVGAFIAAMVDEAPDLTRDDLLPLATEFAKRLTEAQQRKSRIR